MSGTILAVLGVATITLAFRLIGYIWVIPSSPRLERFSRFLPISVLAAFVTSALYRQPQQLESKTMALLFAALVMRGTRQLGLAVLLGLATLWVMAWLGH